MNSKKATSVSPTRERSLPAPPTPPASDKYNQSHSSPLTSDPGEDDLYEEIPLHGTGLTDLSSTPLAQPVSTHAHT